MTGGRADRPVTLGSTIPYARYAATRHWSEAARTVTAFGRPAFNPRSRPSRLEVEGLRHVRARPDESDARVEVRPRVEHRAGRLQVAGEQRQDGLELPAYELRVVGFRGPRDLGDGRVGMFARRRHAAPDGLQRRLEL